MLNLSVFSHNHHPSGVKMLQNLFDVKFRLYSMKHSFCFIQMQPNPIVIVD